MSHFRPCLPLLAGARFPLFPPLLSVGAGILFHAVISMPASLVRGRRRGLGVDVDHLGGGGLGCSSRRGAAFGPGLTFGPVGLGLAGGHVTITAANVADPVRVVLGNPHSMSEPRASID